MPWNLLILPLLGGYFFSTQFVFTREIVRRHSRERLIFSSALAAVFLLPVARLVAVSLAYCFPFLLHWKATLAPFDFFGTAVIALFLGLAVPSINYIITLVISGVTQFRSSNAPSSFRSYWKRARSYRRHTERAIDLKVTDAYRYDVLHEHLRAAQAYYQPVAVTMAGSGKVFIGFVLYVPPDLIDEDARIKLLVLGSGYRDQSQSLHITNWYLKPLSFIGLSEEDKHAYLVSNPQDRWMAELTEGDLCRIFDAGDMEYLNNFDLDVYQYYKSPDDPSPQLELELQ